MIENSTWLAAYGKGFVTMAALIVAIGAQNSFVLRQGLKRQAVFMVATICFLCDAILVALATAGLAALFAAHPLLSILIAFGGAAFLLVYGIRSLLAAKRAQGFDLSSVAKVSRANIAGTTLALSLLNPHVYLDTVVIIGGMTTRFEGTARFICALGAITMSAVWFYGLAYGARSLAPVLAKAKVWRVIDLIIGIMMLTLAAGLARDGYLALQNY